MADLESLPVLWDDASELLKVDAAAACRSGGEGAVAPRARDREPAAARLRRESRAARLARVGPRAGTRAVARQRAGGLGYALVPVLDFVNHADDRDGAQRLGFRVDEHDIYLIANRDFRRGAEAASSYVGGVGPLPADYALHAFGFVPDGYRSCAVRVGDHEVALTTTGDKAWDAAALLAAREAAPDGR